MQAKSEQISPQPPLCRGSHAAGRPQQIEGLGISNKLQQDAAAGASLDDDCCQESQHGPAAIGHLHLPGVAATEPRKFRLTVLICKWSNSNTLHNPALLYAYLLLLNLSAHLSRPDANLSSFTGYRSLG